MGSFRGEVGGLLEIEEGEPARLRCQEKGGANYIRVLGAREKWVWRRLKKSAKGKKVLNGRGAREGGKGMAQRVLSEEKSDS